MERIDAVWQTEIPGLPPPRRGKVRDVYDLGEHLLLVASDGLLTRVGSVTSGRQRFMPWRPASGGEPTLEALIRELLNPAALLDYLRSCVAFEEDERGNIVKKVAGYHQFRAVRKARAQVIAAQALTAQELVQKTKSGVEYNGRPGGVVWHTQGSGKSLTMLMLAGTLVRAGEMANPTVVIVTDRNDLDDQLFDTFAMGRALLRQDPVQADGDIIGHLDVMIEVVPGGIHLVFPPDAKAADAAAHRCTALTGSPDPDPVAAAGPRR